MTTNPLRRALMVSLFLIFAAGCDPGTATDTCHAAAAYLQTCYPDQQVTDNASCDVEQAQQILEKTCDQLQSAKADGEITPYCFWMPYLCLSDPKKIEVSAELQTKVLAALTAACDSGEICDGRVFTKAACDSGEKCDNLTIVTFENLDCYERFEGVYRFVDCSVGVDLNMTHIGDDLDAGCFFEDVGSPEKVLTEDGKLADKILDRIKEWIGGELDDHHL